MDTTQNQFKKPEQGTLFKVEKESFEDMFNRAAKHFLENMAEKAHKRGETAMYVKLLRARQNMRA